MTDQGTAKPSLSVAGRKRSGSATAAGDQTPTTPRPTQTFSDPPPTKDALSEESTSNTPTRKDFPTVQGQRPFPDDPFPPSKPVEADSADSHEQALSREESRHSIHSVRSSNSQDIEMGDGDDDPDVPDGSDNDSVTSDSQNPPKKKKKGQRFYCTDFPPCQLSFTRSEHLARHIRKHTGERPFQCHCSRRFSRLDNLRQHAQTVHVNEEIPGDSLAATGTRFQRQIRTDRVRPPNSRPRASTASSHGGHSRGHSRNLSASSIISNTSSVGTIEDSRPRPAPLALSHDGAARARLSSETFNPAIGNAGTQYGVFQQQPSSGYSTPTSSTFSVGAASPQFSSGMPSPPSTLSRSSFYNGSRTPSRRLSVPSGASPYQPVNHGMTYPPQYYNAMPGAPMSGYSNTSSLVASPTSSVFSHSRRESDVGDGDWRRRTWHPGTHSNYAPRPATSGLSYHQTPDDAAPTMSSQPAASQVTRLPGIESFDHAPPPAAVAPPRNVTSPMQVDQHGRPMSFGSPPEGGPVQGQDERRPSAWEAGLHQNLNRLEIGSNAAPSWHQHSRSLSNSSRPTTAPHTGFPQQHYQGVPQPLQPPAEIRQGPYDSPNNHRDRGTKRQAWYGGPLAPHQASQPILIGHRTSPESNSSDGVPTPSTSQGREMHPAIRHANGMIEMQPPSTVPSSVLSEEQQHMMQAHYQDSKPEPIRADSGFHSYPHPQPLPGGQQMPPTYVMHSGHDVHMHHSYAQAAPRQSNDMGRLEALVAVATSENRAVEHRS